ncbi:MAG TPA: hypothetical protein VLM43_20570, partial [Desulfobacterales bacterium]|nr:hypothetical protein [Desulfobacterales bacterium]
MKQNKELKVRFFAGIFGFLFLLSLLSAPVVLAADDVQTLKEQLNSMSQQMEELQKKIDAMEAAESDKKEQLEEMDNRLNKAELH